MRGDGENLIDFMYVDDAVDGFLALVKARGARATVDFASGTPVSVNHVVQTMARTLGVDVTVRHEGAVAEYIEFRSVDTHHARHVRHRAASVVRDRIGAAPRVSRRRRSAGREERMSGKQRVVVLGAGPAGITAAWRLSELGHDVTVLERDDAVGGMARTIPVGKYLVDFGPHTFHIRETEESRTVLKSIQRFFGDDPLILTRGTRVLLRGKEYVYPLEMLQVLTGVSPLLSARIIFDYVVATLKSTFAPAKKEDSFEEWGVRNLGRTLYDLCFGIYSARVWGLPTSQISSKQAQRVAKLNLKNIILRTLGIKADPATYFTKYMYPRKGISLLYEGMAGEVRAAGNVIKLQAPAVRLEREGDRIARVAYTEGGQREDDRRATSCCPRCRCRRSST